jgi:membrane associated rhomboid family serine protease
MTLTSLLPEFSKSPATSILMLLIFMVSLLGLKNKTVFAALILHPSSIFNKKEYYRIFTADFVHVDLVHLILNEVTLYVFCSDLEETLNRVSSNGSWKFIIIFLVSQLTGNVITIIKNRKNFNYSSAGCSGSVMGCLFAFMVIDPQGIRFYYSFIGGISNVYAGLIYIILLMAYMRKRKNSMINHEIHFYGALGGIMAAILLFPHIIF